MEIDMLGTALEAAVIIADPTRLMFLAGGVLIGLALGVIPGLGGIVGMALLLPFTFDLDPYTAFALLLGMGSVTTTSDTIPAVLFGVPGTAGSAATILDGHPLARQGQAGRAFGAAYTASMMGGIFGALLLAVSIPILRPVMLTVGAPELLSFAFFGLCMVSVLSGSSPLRGLAAAGFGLMIAMVGQDPQTGTLRWTLDSLYLWSGMPLVPVTLGIFALPELADMLIEKRTIASDGKLNTRQGQWQGVRDTFENWWLVLRVAFLGSTLGAVPGLGAAIIDWIAYGHAARTEKGAAETFGKGDIRGVLASEGANNAKEGGALVPTIAFGVPGSASMAILLGAFLIHGLVPGPDMLNQNLDVTYVIVWSVGLANILGAGLCFMFSDQLAKIAIVRHSIIMPLILTVIMVGAYQARRHWGDLYTLMCFGVLGWSMKRLKWPRPPVILGVVLGGIVERYFNISVNRYAEDWETLEDIYFWLVYDHYIVIGVLLLSVWGLYRPFLREVRRMGGPMKMLTGFNRFNFDLNSVFYAVFIGILALMLYDSLDWKEGAKRVPIFVAWVTLFVAGISFFNHSFRGEVAALNGDGKATAGGQGQTERAAHLDIEIDDSIEGAVVIRRAAGFFMWLVAFLISTYLVGMLATILFFVIAFMRVENREPWRLVAIFSVGLTGFSWFLFDFMLLLPWPRSLVGTWIPFLADNIPSM